jgi:hypothetical protein
LEAIELVCGCCELCLSVAELGSSKREARDGKAAQTARVVRMAREEKRGVRLTFAKRRIVDVEFLAGPAAGKRASTMPDMELKRLALSMPHRTARFAIRRYLIHRKAGRVAAPEDAVIRR